jgi:hypothetical protein
MSEHTKGPWKVCGAKQESLSIRADHHGVICDIPGYGVGARMANADLIAAAPDLLEACRALIDYDEMSEGDDGALIMHYADMLRLARTAIAKARGDQ